MREIKRYIEQSGLTAVGFCSPETSQFYAKCGYQILVHGVQRFSFVTKDGQAPPDHADDDVLYIDGGGLIKELVENPGENLVAYRSPW